MAQFFQDNMPLLQKDTGTQISLPATYNGQPARSRIGGQGYRWSSSLACNLSTTGAGALDTGTLAANTLYWVYLVVSSNTPYLVASTSAPTSGPTGFTQYRAVGKFRTQFGSAAVADMAVVNLMVGAGDEIPAVNTTEWTYTTTGITSSGGGAVSVGTGGSATDALKWRRVGSAMEVQLQLTFGTSGASFGTGLAYRINLPTGYNFITTGLSASITGYGRLYDSNVSTYVDTCLIWGGAGNYLLLSPLDGTNIDMGPTSPFTFAASDSIQAVFTVPIAEWVNLFS